jgi:sugar phosphate isomerase/epimerase
VEKYDLTPTFHTHDKYEDPNEVASAESLVKLLNMSPRFMINLDIGHFTAGNQDAPAFLREHHDRITHLHVKDRKRNHGPNVAWGTGDTPIVECLHIIRDAHYPIYALVEREYHSPEDGTPVEETRKDIEYMERALLT